jgi:hypothetical protein
MRWAPAMTRNNRHDAQADDDELALVMACDALLRAASTEQDVNRSGGSARDLRGRERLRLLLKMLEVSETSTDVPPAAAHVGGGACRRRRGFRG